MERYYLYYVIQGDYRCGFRICVRGGPKQDFADIAQRSHGSGKNLGLKIGGRGGGARLPPP